MALREINGALSSLRREIRAMQRKGIGGVAFHEAGHALVAHVLKSTIVSAHVAKNRLSGKVIHRELQPLDDAVIAIAGFVGSSLAGFAEGSPPPGDARCIFECARKAGRELDSFSAEIFERASKILRADWKAVERLAEALSDRGHLTGAQVKELIQGGRVQHKRLSLSRSVALDADDERTVVARVSAEVVDRDGDVLLVDGMDATDFAKNPIILPSHDYSALPVGRCVSIGVDDGEVVAKIQFAARPADHPADSEWMPSTLFHLYRCGAMSAFSVGFIPLAARPASAADRKQFGDDCRQVITKWRLLEISCVAIPANPNAVALVTSAKRI